MSNTVFSAADILIPREELLPDWSVVACDQFTSEPEYWQRVKERTDGKVSSYSLILPEAELETVPPSRIRDIHSAMELYLKSAVFRVFPDCFVYTERTLQSGRIRKGLLGKVDLTRYDYSGTVDAPVRATEATVRERIPPRMAVRRDAPLELPHILLLCEDEENTIMQPLAEKKTDLPKLYDFDLMMEGGHISGWLVSGREKVSLEQRLLQYEAAQRVRHPGMQLLYAVGDGNHSLATAKAVYEEQRKSIRNVNWSEHPARWALCELNNIFDDAQSIEPIHRLIKNCDVKSLVNALQHAFGTEKGVAVSWFAGECSGVFRVDCSDGSLPIAKLQAYLDSWLSEHDGSMDYIHGDRTLIHLSREPASVGFILPAIGKEEIFSGILSHGVLPRKTFSMGDAQDKRYYLESREICK